MDRQNNTWLQAHADISAEQLQSWLYPARAK